MYNYHLLFNDGTEICVPESEEGHIGNGFEDLAQLFGVFDATDEFIEAALAHTQHTGEIIMADAGQF